MPEYRVRHCNLTAPALRIKSGLCNIIGVMDSNGAQDTKDRWKSNAQTHWKPDAWRGCYATTVPWNYSATLDQCNTFGDAALDATASVTKTNVQVGEVPPGALGRGYNLRGYKAYQFGADSLAFNTFVVRAQMPIADATDQTTRFAPRFYYDWLRSVNARVGLVYMSSTDSLDPSGGGANRGPRLAGYDRANTRGTQVEITNLRTASGWKYAETANIAMGSTLTNQYMNAELQLWNDTNKSGKYLHIQQFRFYVPGLSTGLSINTCAQGGATTRTHATEAGQSITANAVTFDSGYLDAAMNAECAALDYNLNWHHLGQNPTGGTIASELAEIEQGADRWRAAMVADGQSPLTILSTPWPTDSTTRWQELADGIEAICLRRGWGCLDLYGECMREFGSHTATIAALCPSGYGPSESPVGTPSTDQVHLSLWGGVWRARKEWSLINAAANSQVLTNGVVAPLRGRR